MNETKILKGLIKCLHCNYAFTYTSPTLLCCSGYRTKKTCEYISWKEEEVLEIIKEHLEREEVVFEENNEYLKQYISKVYLGKNGTYKIEFKNGKICGWDGNSLIL